VSHPFLHWYQSSEFFNNYGLGDPPPKIAIDAWNAAVARSPLNWSESKEMFYRENLQGSILPECAPGQNSVEQLRQMGVEVGQAIVSDSGSMEIEITPIWMGDAVAVVRVRERKEGEDWSEFREAANWTFAYRQWRRKVD
jgi:hypothetical protein